MAQMPAMVLEPRKSPVQARSAASVDAILEATLQVLLLVGKERLTTTRVALRAGVSVGTLYQYFPNKSALLQAALKRHMDAVAEAVERACEAQRGEALLSMGTAVIRAYLQAKLADGRASVALYAVSSDVDGVAVVAEVSARVARAMVAMWKTSCEPLGKSPELITAVLRAAMAGVSRMLLESGAPEEQFGDLQDELIALAGAYLETCVARN